MASIKYTYTKFIAPDLLEFQIRTSSIKVALDYITARANDCDIWFKQTLDTNDESILTSLINFHVPIPLVSAQDPKDGDNAPIFRQKSAKAGWAYQLHSLSFCTSKIGSFLNQSLNPTTRVTTDLGFASVKFYGTDKVTLLQTESDIRTLSAWTVIDWMPSHDMEVIGGYYFQNEPPSDNAFMWVHLAPGILNYPFVQGGINLRMLGQGGTLQADGRVSKFMSATVPFPGTNKFRVTINHPVGLQHEAQFMFNLFKPLP